MLFKRGDIIWVSEGFNANISIPKNIILGTKHLSKDIFKKDICIGEKITFENFPLQNLRNDIKDLLSDFNITDKENKINDFLMALNIKQQKKVFDTMLLTGRYKVYYSGYNPNWINFVYCENLNNPEIEISFVQDNNYFNNHNSKFVELYSRR